MDRRKILWVVFSLLFFAYGIIINKLQTPDIQYIVYHLSFYE